MVIPSNGCDVNFAHIIQSHCPSAVKLNNVQGGERYVRMDCLSESTNDWWPGPRLNIKTIFPNCGDSHVEDKTVGNTVLSLT